MNTHIGYSPCPFHLNSWQLTTTHCLRRSLEGWAVITHWVTDVKSSVCQYCVTRSKIAEERTMLCDIFITCPAAPSIEDKTNCALRCYTNEVFDSVVMFILWICLGPCQQICRTIFKYFETVSDHYTLRAVFAKYHRHCFQQNISARPLDQVF